MNCIASNVGPINDDDAAMTHNQTSYVESISRQSVLEIASAKKRFARALLCAFLKRSISCNVKMHIFKFF